MPSIGDIITICLALRQCVPIINCSWCILFLNIHDQLETSLSFDEEVAFLEAPTLSFKDKKEWTGTPLVSSEKASVFGSCCTSD